MILAILCFVYPLLVGVPKGTSISTPSALTIPGNLGDNHVVFIIDRFKFPQISSIREITNWASAIKHCEAIGSALVYPKVESNIYNFLDQVRALYPTKMEIDSANECTCRADHYDGGLLVVRVVDNEPHVVEEILSRIRCSYSVSFMASTNELFRY